MLGSSFSLLQFMASTGANSAEHERTCRTIAAAVRGVVACCVVYVACASVFRGYVVCGGLKIDALYKYAPAYNLVS